jgi:hypothetical protein
VSQAAPSLTAPPPTGRRRLRTSRPSTVSCFEKLCVPIRAFDFGRRSRELSIVQHHAASRVVRAEISFVRDPRLQREGREISATFVLSVEGLAYIVRVLGEVPDESRLFELQTVNRAGPSFFAAPSNVLQEQAPGP